MRTVTCPNCQQPVESPPSPWAILAACAGILAVTLAIVALAFAITSAFSSREKSGATSPTSVFHEEKSQAKKTQTVAPKTPEERLVATFVVDHAREPSGIQFIQWGPHDFTGEADRRWDELPSDTPPKHKTVRVLFRTGTGVEYDVLFYIVDGEVQARATVNGYGRQWIDACQKGTLSKMKFMEIDGKRF